MDMTAIVSLLTVFGVAPIIVFGFIFLSKRSRNQVEIMRMKRDITELEVRKEEAKARALIEENRKYDRIIDGRGG
jgi:energy-converting hydrogenase Eha subunit H